MHTASRTVELDGLCTKGRAKKLRATFLAYLDRMALYNKPVSRIVAFPADFIELRKLAKSTLPDGVELTGITFRSLPVVPLQTD